LSCTAFLLAPAVPAAHAKGAVSVADKAIGLRHGKAVAGSLRVGGGEDRLDKEEKTSPRYSLYRGLFIAMRQMI